MQMLAAGGRPAFSDGVRGADASNPRGYLEHERVKSLARDSGWVAAAENHALKVVAPLLPLLPAGPAYRVVFVQRDMDEVLRSQAAMLATSGNTAGRPDALRQAFVRHLADARAWAAAHAEAVLTLDHRALIATPREAARELAEFAGDGLDAAAMAAVVDPSLHRQRSAHHA
jgi:hypothetical protein